MFLARGHGEEGRANGEGGGEEGERGRRRRDLGGFSALPPSFFFFPSPCFGPQKWKLKPTFFGTKCFVPEAMEAVSFFISGFYPKFGSS